MPPGRPIISDCNSESCAIAEYIDHFLAPLVTTHLSYLRDTQHFLDEISILANVPEDALLITMDVNALYTNICNKDGLEAVRNTFQQNPNPERSDKHILQLRHCHGQEIRPKLCKHLHGKMGRGCIGQMP